MIRRLLIAAAFVFAVAPATLMAQVPVPAAQTYYFINQNPNYSDAAAEQDTSGNPLWVADVIEISTDSSCPCPSGFTPVTLDELHQMSLLAPSESMSLA